MAYAESRGHAVAPDRIEQLRKMDAPANMAELAEIGAKAAAAQVTGEHLPAAF
jgi:hypothetical protein